MAIVRRALLIALGILYLLLGIIAIVVPAATSVAAVIVLGIVLIIGGLAYALAALAHPTEHRWLAMGIGALAFVVGILVLAHPGRGVLLISAVIGLYFFVAGLFRLGAGLFAGRQPGRGWVIVSGLLDLVLGIIIFANWPSPALWLIGLLVGIDLLFAGVWMIVLGLAAPAPT